MATRILINSLTTDLEWFQNKLEEIAEKGIQEADPIPQLDEIDDAYARYVNENSLNINERLLIILSLSQYLDPALLRKLVREDNEFRLVQCSKTGVLLPTGETFLKLVSQNSLQKRVECHRYLGTDHLFYRKSVLRLGEATSDASAYYGVLNLTASFRELFLYNRHSSPRLNKEFPAHLLETHLNWNDLIINPVTAERLEEIKAFLDHGETLRKEWGLSNFKYEVLQIYLRS